VSQASERSTYREMRLALVFNGGVSLAVWMGGVATEIDRFRSAFYRPEVAALGPYRGLLDSLRTEVVTDVIAGTSAGGINGAMLGFVVANGRTLEAAGGGANPIKEIWQQLGSFDKLLGSKEPDSALDGQFLFQGCANAFHTLGGTAALPDDAPTRMRLTVTATDSAGYEVEEEGVTARDHRLELRFRHVPRPEASAIKLSPSLREAIACAVPPSPGDDGSWPFPEPQSARDLCGDKAASLLTRATRTTASFPIAFAASEVLLDDETGPIDGDTTGLTATPSMGEVVSARGVSLDDEPVRYAIDGGVWDNAPFAAVLRAIDRSPASHEVDRRLVYVIYTDQEVSDQPHDAEDLQRPPNLIDSVAHALTMPSNVAFANDLERIRVDMEQQKARRRGFASLLDDGDPDVFKLAPQLLGVYRRRVATEHYANAIPKTIPACDTIPACGDVPARRATLAEWFATPGDWCWDLRPVQVSIEVGRRLLGQVLQGLPTDASALHDAIRALTDAREVLSQLAWALSDLQDRRPQRALTDTEREVCGWVMAQFADTVAGLNGVLGGLSSSPLSEAASSAVKIASSLAGGGSDMVIKRAIATEISMHAMTSDERRHKVDYRFDTIRPDVSWPLPIDEDGPRPLIDQDVGRPPLAGTRYKHFGGFMRTSWRLSDWMWGRLDASSRIVDMLLDVEQLRRLSVGRTEARSELAARFAELAIPADDEMTSARILTLAYAAFAAHGILDKPNAPPDPRSNTGNATLAVETWRELLAEVYREAIDVILAPPPPPTPESTRLSTSQSARAASPESALTPPELVLLRADLRRSIQYAILDDERQGLVEEIVAERNDPRFRVDGEVLSKLPDLEVLETRMDGGLSEIVEALDKKLPTLMLARYAERASANTLDALQKPGLAVPLRALGAATKAAQAIENAKDAAAHYIFHRHGKSAD
jgi:hypothetical protein